MSANRNPIAALIAQCDGLSVKALEIEADARSGTTLTPEQLAEFVKNVREGFESMGTMMRSILAMIERGTG